MSLPIKIFTSGTTGDSAAPRTNGVSVTGTNVYYSKMWSGESTTAYDLQIFFDGTATGTLILQVSDLENPDETTDVDWVTSTEITLDNPAGADLSKRYSTVSSPAYRKRLKYTNASGTSVAYGYVVVPRNFA